ncbi:hypothetical protein ACQ5SK_40730 [Bradyrhizobium japonicum]
MAGLGRPLIDGIDRAIDRLELRGLGLRGFALGGFEPGGLGRAAAWGRAASKSTGRGCCARDAAAGVAWSQGARPSSCGSRSSQLTRRWSAAWMRTRRRPAKR